MNLKPSYYNYLARLENGKTILMNFLTSAMLELDSSERSIVEDLLADCNQEPTGDAAILKNKLISASYLVPADANELDIIRIRNLSSRYDNLIYNLVLMPTLECNFACKYCYETHYKGFMSPKIQQGVINWGQKIAKVSKRLVVNWFGGEPLLDFSIVENLNHGLKQVCQQNNCNFVSDITTNGYFITDEILQKTAALNISRFQITIDGPPTFHNQYRPLLDGGPTFDVVFTNVLKILRHTNAQVALRINVDNQNYDYIPEFLAMIPTEYRTPRLLLVFKDIFSDPGGTTGREEAIRAKQITSFKQMKKLYLHAMGEGFNMYIPQFTMQKHHCSSGNKNYFIIHPSGDLYRCTVEFETGKKVGHLSEDGNISIDSFGTARWMGYTPGDDEKCAKCIFLPICQGGCRYNRMMGKKPCALESTDLNGVIELFYLAKAAGQK